MSTEADHLVAFNTIMDEVRQERARQDARFGVQDHPNGTSPQFKGLADAARNATRKAVNEQRVTWFHVLKEEFWEAMAESDRTALRAELIQVVAVGVAWIECIDRNP
jgi:hypothetical protein